MTWLWLFPLAALLAAAYRWQFWRLPKKGLTVLMYHHIGHTAPDDAQYPFTISPQHFSSAAGTCCKNTVLPPIGLDELKAAFQTGKPLPAKPVFADV